MIPPLPYIGQRLPQIFLPLGILLPVRASPKTTGEESAVDLRRVTTVFLIISFTCDVLTTYLVASLPTNSIGIKTAEEA